MCTTDIIHLIRVSQQISVLIVVSLVHLLCTLEANCKFNKVFLERMTSGMLTRSNWSFTLHDLNFLNRRDFHDKFLLPFDVYINLILSTFLCANFLSTQTFCPFRDIGYGLGLVRRTLMGNKNLSVDKNVLFYLL